MMWDDTWCSHPDFSYHVRKLRSLLLRRNFCCWASSLLPRTGHIGNSMRFPLSEMSNDVSSSLIRTTMIRKKHPLVDVIFVLAKGEKDDTVGLAYEQEHHQDLYIIDMPVRWNHWHVFFSLFLLFCDAWYRSDWTMAGCLRHFALHSINLYNHQSVQPIRIISPT